MTGVTCLLRAHPHLINGSARPVNKTWTAAVRAVEHEGVPATSRGLWQRLGHAPGIPTGRGQRPAAVAPAGHNQLCHFGPGAAMPLAVASPARSR